MNCWRAMGEAGEGYEGHLRSDMTGVTQTTSLGWPIKIDQIDRELKKLWIDDEGTMTRASLINLAVYSDDPDSLPRNTELLSRITEDHACRAIVIAANPQAGTDRAEASINAHCHARSGAKQICSEQISFRLEGAKLLTSILFSHLDSDLPLYLWWQSPLRAPIDPQLWAWVDRLIYDSHDWNDFDSEMRLAEAAQHEAEQRQMVLCDLNWARLLRFRLAFAQFFDHPASHRHFGKIENISLVFGRGYRSTALLFIGWLAAQLGWDICESDDVIELKNGDGKSVRADLREEGEAPLASFTAQTRELEFCVRRAKCGDLLDVCRGRKGKEHAHQFLPADDGDLAALVSEELFRGGERRVYLRAVEKVQSLL
jgi:glucose-6-phosphate dehydrogenase assembly protein OpcA